MVTISNAVMKKLILFIIIFFCSTCYAFESFNVEDGRPVVLNVVWQQIINKFKSLGKPLHKIEIYNHNNFVLYDREDIEEVIGNLIYPAKAVRINGKIQGTCVYKAEFYSFILHHLMPGIPVLQITGWYLDEYGEKTGGHRFCVVVADDNETIFLNIKSLDKYDKFGDGVL